MSSVPVAPVSVYFHVRQEILWQDAATEEERCCGGDAESWRQSTDGV